MGRFLKKLVIIALLAGVAWKINELMTIQREATTPEIPQG